MYEGPDGEIFWDDDINRIKEDLAKYLKDPESNRRKIHKGKLELKFYEFFGYQENPWKEIILYLMDIHDSIILFNPVSNALEFDYPGEMVEFNFNNSIQFTEDVPGEIPYYNCKVRIKDFKENEYIKDANVWRTTSDNFSEFMKEGSPLNLRIQIDLFNGLHIKINPKTRFIDWQVMDGVKDWKPSYFGIPKEHENYWYNKIIS